MAITATTKESIRPVAGAGFDLVLRPWPSAEDLRVALTERQPHPNWKPEKGKKKGSQEVPLLPPVAELDELAEAILLATPMTDKLVTKRLVVISPVCLGFTRGWVEGPRKSRVPPEMPTRRQIFDLLPKYGLRVCHPQVAFELPFAQRLPMPEGKILVLMAPIQARGVAGTIVFERGSLIGDSGRMDLCIAQHQQMLCEIVE